MSPARIWSLPSRVLRRVVPPPRRPVLWWHAWPLALFLAAYAAVIAWLEISDRALFAAPWHFLWLLATPWAWWAHAAGWGGMRGTRGALSLLTRLALIGTFAAVLAEPRAVRTSDALSLVYVLDRSDSIGEQVSDQALEWVLTTAGGKPPKDNAGLVVFGRDAAVELPPRESFPFEAVNSRLASDGTDLEQALALAAAVLPHDAPGRIVLISDGTATQGDLDRALDLLAARQVPVDVLKIAYAREDEVWVEKLELPHEARPGQTYEAGVVLGSLRNGTGELVLRENGAEIARRRIDWRGGKSRFTLPLYLRGPGHYEYVAAIEPTPGQDGWRENNHALGAISLAGEGRVLLAVDGDGRDADWGPLARALKQAGRAVEVRRAVDLPDDPMALMGCDAVALVNVPAESLVDAQQRALRDAVQDLGIGLVMIGGTNGYGPGGWNRTPVEEALPVTMDINQRKVMPKGALAIVLHTCEFGEGNAWAKRITKQAMKVLGARDDVGVLDYDYKGGEQWVFPLTPAGEYDRLAPLVEAAEPGDMPSFATIMQKGLDGLKASDASAKHMIVISDGDPAPPPPELVQAFIDAKVSVSMVAVFPHGGQEQSSMRAVADATKGRYYYPQDAQKLPSIFIKEAKTLKRSQHQNRVFTPETRFPSPILKGIPALPALKGYTLTTPKPRAVTVLEGPDPEEEDPVLAVWRFGTGAAAAWTSDLAPNWAANWVEWEQYQAFVEQLFEHVSRAQERTSLRLRVDGGGGSGVITVEDHHPDGGFLAAAARITTPDGARLELELPQVAPGRYSATFPVAAVGRYQVAVSAVGGAAGAERKERAFGSLAVPYSAEYLRFRANPMVLDRIAARTGGRQLAGTEDGAALFGIGRQPRASSRPVFDLLLVALALLLPLDVALRRVQIDPRAMFLALAARLGRRRAGDSTGTMGALLARKQLVELPKAAANQLPPARPSPASAAPAPGAAPKPATTPATKPAAKPGVPPASGIGTTSKLLDAKRRRQDPSKPQDPPP